MFVRERNELIILKIEDLNESFLHSFSNFHSNFPNVICYVENRLGKIEGIFSWREFNQSNFLGKITLNKEFKFIECDELGAIEDFKKKYWGYTNVPYVLNGMLVREYCFSEDMWISWNFEWELIPNEIFIQVVKRHVEKHGKMQICCDHLKARFRNMNFQMTDDSQKAEICILDMPHYYKHVRKMYGQGMFFDDEQILSEYNLYIECLILMMQYKFQENNIRCMYFGSPNASKMIGISDRERNLILNPQTIEDMEISGELDEIYLGYEKSREFMKKKEYKDIRFRFFDGHYAPIDYSSPTCNIIGGIRKTDFVPENAKHNIIVYGICVARGAFVADCDTVESFLQRRINKESTEWKVVNCGVAEGVIGAALNDFQYVLHSEFKSNDLILFLSEYDERTVHLLQNSGWEIYELSEVFEGKNEKERWFLDIMPHTTPSGNRRLADYIYNRIAAKLHKTENASAAVSLISRDSLALQLPEGIKEYVLSVKSKLNNCGVNQIIGSIVMNCNPFTYGHLYLIEQAKKQVDILLVFVVSEDRSEFRFVDRFEMVKKAVSICDPGGGRGW